MTGSNITINQGGSIQLIELSHKFLVLNVYDNNLNPFKIKTDLQNKHLWSLENGFVTSVGSSVNSNIIYPSLYQRIKQTIINEHQFEPVTWVSAQPTNANGQELVCNFCIDGFIRFFGTINITEETQFYLPLSKFNPAIFDYNGTSLVLYVTIPIVSAPSINATYRISNGTVLFTISNYPLQCIMNGVQIRFK